MNLAAYTDQQLLEEVARRMQVKLPYSARTQPKKFATKAEWAEAQAADMHARYEQVAAETATGYAAEQRKSAALRSLSAEERKFQRMAESYRRKGE